MQKTIKKVALVAAAALTFAGISGVAAHATAAATATWVATANTTAASAASTAATASATADGNHYVTIKLAASSADSDYTISTSGVGAFYGTATSATNYLVYSNGSNAVGGFTWSKSTFPSGSAFGGTETMTVNIVSTVAGTQTVTATPTNGTSGASTITITWGAAPSLQAQYSTAYIDSTSDTETVDATISASGSASTSVAAYIAVNLNSAASTGITGQGLTASVSGPGLISVKNHALTGVGNTDGCDTTKGKSITVAASAANLATWNVCVYPDGNTGTSSITLTSGTFSVTKTVTFYGVASKAVATQNLFVGATNATLGKTSAAAAQVATAYATTYAYTVAVTDANGNAANPAANVKTVISDTTIISSSTCTQLSATPGSYNCDVVVAQGAASGKSATVTFEASADSGVTFTVLASPLTFKVGGAVAKEVLSLDAASYDPGATVTLTATATDSKGNAAYDGQTTAGTWTSTRYVGTLPAANYYVNGKATWTLYAPSISGAFTLGATGVDANTTALSVAGTVNTDTTASDAASLATDAANAATDAANAAAASADNATQAASDALAAVQALDEKVTSLISALQKQIAALAKAVAAKKK